VNVADLSDLQTCPNYSVVFRPMVSMSRATVGFGAGREELGLSKPTRVKFLINIRSGTVDVVLMRCFLQSPVRDGQSFKETVQGRLARA